MDNERIAETPPCRNCDNRIHYRGREDGELHCFSVDSGRLTGKHYEPANTTVRDFAPLR